MSIPVIASGGGGTAEHVAEAFTEGKADAAILASILHYGTTTIPDIKRELLDRGLPIRPWPLE